ncbi:MAG: penicillin-binding protein 2 [Candidatus Bipolaricaulia bacterium]
MKDLGRRVTWLLTVSMALFLILIGRIVYLQVVEAGVYLRLAQSNRTTIQELKPPRGVIFDRYGVPLAVNRPSYVLHVVPAYFDRGRVEQLASVVDFDRDTLETILTNHREWNRPIPLKRRITKEEAIILEELSLPGVQVQVVPVREYQDGEIFAHVLGYARSQRIGGDLIGAREIEKRFDAPLQGTKGGIRLEVDATGRILGALDREDPIPGRNIHLTVDLGIQQAAYEALKGNPGAIIVMDPRNGDILAMVSQPSLDNNQFITGFSPEAWEAVVEDPRHPLQNRAISGEYQPGSTIKPIIAIAALEEQVTSLNRIIDDNGIYEYRNAQGEIIGVYRGWKRGGHGKVNLVDALAESVNPYFYRLGIELGLERITKYARMFGLGEPTGIDLPNEKPGLIPSRDWKLEVVGEPWYPGNTILLSIGQGYITVTPLQLLNAFNVIANGGTLYRPRIVKEITDDQGRIIRRFEPQLKHHIDVSAETLDIIQQGLRAVVSRGTAKEINIPELPIAGKTGSAEVAMDENANAWFVGYAPADDPQVSVLVLVEAGQYGGQAAAPIAQQLLATVFNLQPQQPPTSTQEARRF